MSLSERIEAAEASLVTMKDSLVEATNNLEAAPEEEALLVEVEELTEKVEQSTKTINSLKKAEASLAERAKVAPVEADDQQSAFPRPNVHGGGLKKANPEDIFWQMATAKTLAFIERKDIGQVIDERYSGDRAVKTVADYVQRTAVNPAMTNVAGWADSLVQDGVQGFLDTIKNTSVAAAVAARGESMSFGGFNSLKVPRRNPLGATLTEPAWVAEGSPIPLTQFSFGSTTINRYKLAAITTMTREIAERSTPSIEGLLRSALTEAYSEVLDSAFLSNAAAVAGVRPAGVINGVTATAPTAGGGIASVIGDMQKLIGAMVANNMGARPVLLVNTVDRLSASMMVSSLSEFAFRDELSSGRLMGIDVISSNNVPLHSAVLIDASAIVTVFDAPEFDVSDVATVMEASADTTAPTMVANATTGVAGANAGQVAGAEGIRVQGTALTGAAAAGATGRSLWQTYSVGIRCVAPTSWGWVRPNALAHMTATTWTP